MSVSLPFLPSLTLPTLILLLALLGSLIFLLSSLRSSSSSSCPGLAPLVPSLPFIGSALSFGKNPSGFLQSCRDRFGGFFRLRLAGKELVFVVDASLFPSIIKHPDLVFSPIADEISHRVLGVRKEAVGEHMAEVDKEIHGQYIRHLSGAGLEELTQSSYRELRKCFRQDRMQMQKLMGGGGAGKRTVGLYDWLTTLVFDATVATIFGPLSHPPSSAPSSLLSLFQSFDTAFPLLVADLPSFLLRKGLSARATLHSFLYHALFSADAGLKRPSALMKARVEYMLGRKEYEKKDVAALQLAMLWASQANTIPATFWTLFYLLRDRKAWEEVKQEVQEVLKKEPLEQEESMEAEESGSSKSSTVWGREVMAKCVKLESAVNEALRLCTGSMVLRLAPRATTVSFPDGSSLSLRAGDRVALYPSLTHLDAKVFPQPEQFQWDRFLKSGGSGAVEMAVGSGPEGGAMERLKFGYLPFGAGVSMCPGRHWARNEIKIFVALIIQNLDMELVDGDKTVTPKFDVARVGLGIFPPANDVQMRYEYR